MELRLSSPRSAGPNPRLSEASCVERRRYGLRKLREAAVSFEIRRRSHETMRAVTDTTIIGEHIGAERDPIVSQFLADS